MKKTILSVAALALVANPFYARNNKTEQKRPNFLFILVDDESPFDLKCYDPNSILETPTIDRLVAGGMVIESARHMGAMIGAVSTPSRHQIMTGRYLWNLPSIGSEFSNPDCPADIADQTIGAVFNKAGYATMRTCKKGNSYEAANKKFTVVRDATKRGDTEETGSAWHAKQVLEYLDDRIQSKESKPFFIYFGFSHPHDERNGTPELLAKYGAVNHKDRNSLPSANPKQPPLQENYLPAQPFFHGHPGLRDEELVTGVWKNRDERTIRNELGREYACVENIDNQIAKVLKKLDEMGELDNTYIVYTADHGIAIGRHAFMGKQNLYEHTWRVPMIVKGPGIKPGKRAEGNVYLLDLLPTFCDLAGIKKPETVNGTSFKPVLMGKKNTIRDVMYGVYCGGTKPGMRTVKKGDWKLIKYDLMNGAIHETQLFNLKYNPFEYLPEHHKTGKMETNLANDPKYAKKLKEMEALLLEQMKFYKDPYRLWDQPQN